MRLDRIGILNDVLPEDYLELSNGNVICNLRDLVLTLDKMSEEDFGLHVYREQNDFAEWVMEAYWDEKLASKILGISDKKKLIRFLGKILKKAEKKRFENGGKGDVLRRIGKIE